MQVRIILAVLLLRFEWKLSPNYKHKPIAEITLHARHGMPMLMRPASLTPAAT